MARDHETIGSPTLEELADAGLVRCDGCHETLEQIDAESIDGAPFCGDCAAEPAQCIGCARTFPAAWLAEGRCVSCEPPASGDAASEVEREVRP